MEQWQDAASQQVKLLTNRLNELLTKGQLWLRSELGVDLGLKPEIIPPWVILLAACFGLVLMVALWASACRAFFKKHPAVQIVEDNTEVKRGIKPAKPEEQKKKKKKAEKKSQPNGRAVVEPQEEAIVTEEIVPHHQPPTPEVKSEKAAEVKKSKKKAKQAAKEMAKTVITDGKEPEEGTWETKVSNKEKREQRKKDKGSSDGSASPGGGNTPVTTAEQPKASPAPPPANQKKKKGGDAIKVKTEKIEPVVPKVSNKNEPAAVTVAEVKKVPVQTVAPKMAHWATNRDQPASLWGSEIDGSWTVIDRNMQTSDLKLGSYNALGGSAGEPQSVRERPWLKPPAMDDEWSGINGGSVDCNSDWNAPSEVWGNYEEPAPEPSPVEEPSVSEPAKTNLLIGAADNDNEKDKEDLSTDGAAKTKRKKKKKKKAAEEGATTNQGEEPVKEVAPAALVKKQPEPVKPAAPEMKVERIMKDSTAQKPPVTQVPQKPTDGEPTAKQNNPPAQSQQKKPEEASKPTKKKKPRRET